MHLFTIWKFASHVVLRTGASLAQVVSEKWAWSEKFVHEESQDSKDKNQTTNKEKHSWNDMKSFYNMRLKYTPYFCKFETFRGDKQLKQF